MAGAAEAQHLDRHVGNARQGIPDRAFQTETGHAGVGVFRMRLGHVGALPAMQRGGDPFAIGEHLHRDDRRRRQQRPALDAQHPAMVDLRRLQIDDAMGRGHRHGGQIARRAFEDRGLVRRAADSQWRVERLSLPGARVDREVGDSHPLPAGQRQINLESGVEPGAAAGQRDRRGLIALAELDQDKLDTGTVPDVK